MRHARVLCNILFTIATYLLNDQRMMHSLINHLCIVVSFVPSSNIYLHQSDAPVRELLGAGEDSPDAPFLLKFLAGALTGGVGSVIGNPFDVCKTLAQTNTDKGQSLTELVSGMYKAQGIAGFYRGVEVNIIRACILNATKMGVYDVTKGYVTEATGWSRKDIKTSFASAFVAGFFMTVTVAPSDMIRTKLMNQPTDAKLYNGFVDCARKTISDGGVLSLWRGFIPIWAR